MRFQVNAWEGFGIGLGGTSGKRVRGQAIIVDMLTGNTVYHRSWWPKTNESAAKRLSDERRLAQQTAKRYEKENA